MDVRKGEGNVALIFGASGIVSISAYGLYFLLTLLIHLPVRLGFDA